MSKIHMIIVVSLLSLVSLTVCKISYSIHESHLYEYSHSDHSSRTLQDDTLMSYLECDGGSVQTMTIR